jgi:hypothetical protein
MDIQGSYPYTDSSNFGSYVTATNDTNVLIKPRNKPPENSELRHCTAFSVVKKCSGIEANQPEQSSSLFDE